MKIYLIGYTGCGKSTLGKRISRKINFNFVDTDDYIESKFNDTIYNIFRNKGEFFFRNLEFITFKELQSKNKIIISTGAGFPFNSNLIDKMNNSGITIFLKKNIEVLSECLWQFRKKRPRISSYKSFNSFDKFIKQDYKLRESAYMKADYIFNLDKMSNKTILENIFKIINYD
ncbi:MAG: shikimate kinase [Flavobacteriales bacterium TMED288]|nr:shikimate kinase [Flavobacteriales bacterium]RPG53667.1 MAG: shikimate kinase [Flavobacteriales bacterium TMED288]|tara:strand:- start:299 stop:817 length:519 start_codon:yes stop_codon:yes gene_type:complete